MAADSGSNFSGQRARVMSPKVARGPSTGINAALRPPPLTRAQCPTVIPLAVGAGQRVVGRVHRARLSLVLELRVRRGEREGEVDGLLLVDRLLLYTIHELDLLLSALTSPAAGNSPSVYPLCEQKLYSVVSVPLGAILNTVPKLLEPPFGSQRLARAGPPRGWSKRGAKIGGHGGRPTLCARSRSVRPASSRQTRFKRPYRVKITPLARAE